MKYYTKSGKKVTHLRNKELNKQAEAISSAQTDDVIFSAVKALNREKFENPKVEDSEGKLITNPNEILKTVANHLKTSSKLLTHQKYHPLLENRNRLTTQ